MMGLWSNRLCVALVVFVLAATVVHAGNNRENRFAKLYKIKNELSHRQICWNGEMTIRIGVMENQKTIAVTAEEDYQIIGGSEVVNASAGEVLTFKVKSSKKAERLFWPVVKTVESKKEAQLFNTVEQWEELGHKVTVHPAGARLYYRDFLIHDNRRYFVSVEPTDNQTDCEASFQNLIPHGVRPWPLETLTAEASGVMQLVRKNGTVVAEFDGPARLSSNKPLKVFRVEYGVGYPWHGFQDRHFRGILEVRVDKVGALQLISELDIESYLQGVVPSEMSAHYPHHALCSQAIAARGETLAKYGTRHLADPYHLCATQHCQVYGGLTKEHANTNKAVQETRGRVLRHDDLIADTVYSACCGGHTENNDFVWSTEPSPSLRGKSCLKPEADPFPNPMTEAALKVYFSKKVKSYCNLPVDYYQKKFRWITELTQSRIDELVAKKFPNVGSVKELVPLSRGVSGRLRELKVVGSKETIVVQKELPIRFLFGGLRSGAFVVEKKNSKWTFVGAGWGHGVGMCQWGARGMAEAGNSYRKILAHYFTDTYILNVYRLKKRAK